MDCIAKKFLLIKIQNSVKCFLAGRAIYYKHTIGKSGKRKLISCSFFLALELCVRVFRVKKINRKGGITIATAQTESSR